MDVDTRLLRAFVAVAEELNFTRAAERLHLAQQALSAQVRQLEGRLGGRLFERTTRRVSLTGAGEALLPHARSALAAVEAGTAAAVEAIGTARRTLTVGLSTTAVVPVVGQTIHRFGEEEPEVDVVVRNAPFHEATGGLADGRADVAFVRPPFRSDGLSMATVLSEPRLAVLREDHPLATRETVSPRDLIGEPWIGPPHPARAQPVRVSTIASGPWPGAFVHRKEPRAEA